MSECDSSDHPVSVVIVVSIFTFYFFHFFSQMSTAWLYFNFFVDTPLVDIYQYKFIKIRLVLLFYGITRMGKFVQLLATSLIEL